MNTMRIQQSFHEFINSLPPELMLWLPLLAIVVGVAQCFFGWRIFKVVLGVSGFLSGALLVGVFVFSFSNSYIAALIAALFGGLMGAVMLVMIYFLGVFYFGASMGMLIGYLGFSVAGEPYWISMQILLGLVGGIAALVYQRFMIIVSTAVIGATGAVLGALWYYSAGWVPFDEFHMEVIAQQHATLSIVAGTLLSAAGIFVQYWFKPGSRIVTRAVSSASSAPTKVTSGRD